MSFESNFDLSKIPPKSKVGYLSPEIAGEGQSASDFVPYENESNAGWTPPPVKSVFPDISGIKSIQKYFRQYVFMPFPSWVYHPTEEPRKVTEREAFALGVRYRKATTEERVKYGAAEAFYDCQGEWRTTPFDKDVAFNPQKLGPGKTYIPATLDPVKTQIELMRTLAAGQKSSDPAAYSAVLATVDAMQKQIDALQEMLSKTQYAEEAEGAMIPANDNDPNAPANDNEPEVSNALTPEQDKEVWKAAAEQKGIKIDGRWSLKRLKEEVDKVA